VIPAGRLSTNPPTSVGLQGRQLSELQQRCRQLEADLVREGLGRSGPLFEVFQARRQATEKGFERVGHYQVKLLKRVFRIANRAAVKA